MPSWGNTDSAQAKPHFPEERQVRPFASLITANVTAAGTQTITFTGTGAQTAANVGITAGMWPYGGGPGVLTGTGQRDFFKGNNTVASVSTNNGANNTVAFTKPTTASIPAGTTITFDTAIVHNGVYSANTFDDTVIVSSTRLSNTSIFSSKATPHTGWIRVKTGTGGRGGRVQVEVLVALANVQTSNTFSGNTSNSLVYYAGL